tara:strand:+ start:3008 stop:3397 length:390 start_codon:yes stop_codon:yes gene_type:complete
MIEARTNNPGEATQKNETPNTITVSMILEDLDNGIDRTAIQEKYGLEKWEVTQMFQHPALKGKKARKIRKLSFNFVDDTAVDPNQTSIPVESGPDVDVHTEASMIVEATPELQEEDPFIGEYGEDEDEF